MSGKSHNVSVELFCQGWYLAQAPEILSNHSLNSELKHQSCVAWSASLMLSFATDGAKHTRHIYLFRALGL